MPVDFRRPDRIGKSQLRPIHVLHDNFVRNLVSSFSAYFRTYLIGNLVGVEQVSYAEFLEGLPSPTCIASLSLKPYDGNAVMELNPSLIFPILEMLLGGNGKASTKIQREITEIEQNLLDGFFRIVLQDLREAWKTVTAIDFKIESLETEPQLLRILEPNEAVVAVEIELRIGENVGMMNIAMPSIVIKMMRQKFDHQWFARKTESSATEQTRILELIKPAKLSMDAWLHGPTLLLKDLLKLEEGDVLVFDHPVSRPLECTVNGKQKFKGRIVSMGTKKAFLIEDARGNAQQQGS